MAEDSFKILSLEKIYLIAEENYCEKLCCWKILWKKYGKRWAISSQESSTFNFIENGNHRSQDWWLGLYHKKLSKNFTVQNIITGLRRKKGLSRTSPQNKIIVGPRRRSSWDFVAEEDHHGTSSQKRIIARFRHRIGSSWDFFAEWDHYRTLSRKRIIVRFCRKMRSSQDFISNENHHETSSQKRIIAGFRHRRGSSRDFVAGWDYCEISSQKRFITGFRCRVGSSRDFFAKWDRHRTS